MPTFIDIKLNKIITAVKIANQQISLKKVIFFENPLVEKNVISLCSERPRPVCHSVPLIPLVFS